VSRKREPNSVAVLLRLPAFRRLYSAIVVSSLGDWLGLLATTALAAYLTKDSSSLAQGAAVSGVLLVRLAPDLILGPIAGALVDKFDRRVVAIAGDTLAGLLYVSIIVSGNLAWLLIAQFLVEAIGLFSTPAKQAMWVNVVPREKLAVANQFNLFSVYAMIPLAGSVFALLSFIATFFAAPSTGSAGDALISGSTNTLAIDFALAVDAATYFFSAAMVLFSRHLIPSYVGERPPTRGIFSLVAEGFSFIGKNRLMRSIYIGILGAFMAGGLVAGVAQSYVSTLGAGNAGYGILFATAFTGLALGILVGPRVFPTVPRRMIFTPAIGAAGIALFVMAVLQDFVGAALAASVMGMFAGIAWITGFTMIGQEVTDQLRGRVFAFVQSSTRIVLLATIAAGPVLAGAIGSHPVVIGDFNWDITGPAAVLAVGGLIAITVSIIIGRQIGGLTSGLIRRIFRRRALSIWDERDDHAGVLIAVEGADPRAVSVYADGIVAHLHTAGWRIERVRNETAAHPVILGAGFDSPAAALRGSADLGDLTTDRIEPALQAGAVVVCEGFIDSTIVRYRAAGVEEQRLARVAQWAVNGLKADLTVLVDGQLGSVILVGGDQAGLNGAADSATDDGAEPPDPPAEPQPRVSAATNGSATEPAPGVPAPVDSTPMDGAADEGAHIGLLDAGIAEAAEAMGELESDKSAHTAAPAAAGPADDDEEPVDPVQAYRDRASYTPERYLVVQPLAKEQGDINPEVVERISSVLRLRSPSLAEPQPVEPPEPQRTEPRRTEPSLSEHEPSESPAAATRGPAPKPAEPQPAARS
jgi:dTMP kinase